MIRNCMVIAACIINFILVSNAYTKEGCPDTPPINISVNPEPNASQDAGSYKVRISGNGLKANKKYKASINIITIDGKDAKDAKDAKKDALPKYCKPNEESGKVNCDFPNVSISTNPRGSLEQELVTMTLPKGNYMVNFLIKDCLGRGKGCCPPVGEHTGLSFEVK